MVIVPDSKVILIKNPLKLDSNNEMMFANATAQETYFKSLPKIEFDDLTYIRKDGVLRIPTDETATGLTKRWWARPVALFLTGAFIP